MYFITDWTRRIDFDRLREERKQRLSREIEAKGLDALLCFKAESIRYMTGYRPLWWPISFLTRNAAVMAPGQEPILFPTSGCYERCLETMYWMPADRIRPMATMDDPGVTRMMVRERLKPALEELGVARGRIGIDHTTMLILENLKEALPDAQFVDGDMCALDAQVIKNEEEIKCIRLSCRMAEIAMERAMGAIGLGVRECEVLAEAMHAFYSLGMEVPQCNLIVTSGEGTAPLRRFASDRQIGWGELVFLDLGGCFNGYFSDYTRTVIFGEPNERQKAIYRAVYGMMEEIKATMKPGATNREVNEAARRVVVDSGFKGHDYLGLLGHSVGVTGLTAPIIGEIAAVGGEREFELRPGMVFNMEPGIFVPGTPGGGGVRLEDTVLITETGNEVLTRTPYDQNLLS